MKTMKAVRLYLVLTVVLLMIAALWAHSLQTYRTWLSLGTGPRLTLSTRQGVVDLRILPSGDFGEVQTIQGAAFAGFGAYSMDDGSSHAYLFTLPFWAIVGAGAGLLSWKWISFARARQQRHRGGDRSNGEEDTRTGKLS
jgi:hypothetical protein